VLGLLGRTGSGKSTLARLLLRFHDPAAGSVSVGGVDLRELSADALRGRVAFVTQEVQLFRASVRDNATLFDSDVSDARLREAIDALGLRSWLERLPAGLDTFLAGHGGEGVGLSAGEAQLLALTRVFLKDPGLVVLDEPSSRLDPQTERLLERALDELLARRTAVVIAHRLSTIERADTVLILEDGRPVERGPRAALARDPGSRLAALLRTGPGRGNGSSAPEGGG
jgi:ATP-binding cassette subfamily B protein